MTSPDDIWGAARWPGRWRVHRVAETGSTNVDLLARAASGRAGDRTALVAGHQTAGRGRLDRRWEAPPDTNLLVSLLFSPVPADPAELTQRVALASCAAAERLVPGLRVGLKWPNDLLVDGAKIAGILAQRAGPFVVVGLGFNVGWSPEGAADLRSQDLRGKNVDGDDLGGRGVDGVVTPASLLSSLLAEFDLLPPSVADLYRVRLVTLGQPVRAELPGGAVLTGSAVDVDGGGRLVVVDGDGRRHLLDVGDIIHIRPGGG